MSAAAPGWRERAGVDLPGRLLAGTFLAAAALYLLTAFCAVVNFAWLQPLFDQFRLYDIYLSQPFPDNVLQLENGHRPIVPALLRLAEIHAFAANQKLQVVLGTGFAFATALTLALLAWRAPLPLPARAAGVLASVIGVLWLANARMLLHGNEAVHAYLVALCVVSAALCCYRAGRGNATLWLGLASLCCGLATFSFGGGIASFVAVILLAWLQRVNLRALLLPAVTLVACIGVYLFVLPGDASVREQLDMRPLALAGMTARWLSSPWIVAWLGLGDADLYGWAQDYVRAQPLSAAMIALAEAPQRWTGLRWTQTGSVGIGAAGIVTFGLLLLRRLRQREKPDRLETVALGLCLFALATALVVCLGRLQYLQQWPMQAFADRYLVWPCLFWLGLALLLLRSIATHLGKAALHWALLPWLILPAIAWPAHELWIGWGASVYRNLQQSAASARADALDERHFGSNPAVSADVTLRTLQFFRERRLAMYAEPGSDWLGQQFRGGLQAAGTRIAAHAHTREALRDMRDGSPIAHFDGWISSGVRAAHKTGELVVLDADSYVVGFAEFSFIQPMAAALRLDLPRKRGYDGYIRHYDPAARYRLVLLRDLDADGVLLYEF